MDAAWLKWQREEQEAKQRAAEAARKK